MLDSVALVFVNPPPATERRQPRRKAKTGHLTTGTILKSGMTDGLPLFPRLKRCRQMLSYYLLRLLDL